MEKSVKPYVIEDIDSKIRDLSVMYEIALSIGISTDIYREADNFLTKILKRFGYDVGVIMLRDFENNIFRIISAKGSFKTDNLIGSEYKPHQYGINECLNTGHPLVKNELSDSDREFIIMKNIRHEINAYAFFPILFEKEPLGMLRILSFKEGAFPRRSIRMIESLTRRFAIAVNHALTVTFLNKTQDLLSNEREKLLVTLQSIGDAVITTDIKGRITFMNLKAQEITGWSEKKALNKYIAEIFCISDRRIVNYIDDLLSEVFKEDKIANLLDKTTLFTKSGTKKIISGNCSPIRNKIGNIIGMVIVFNDIIEKELMNREIIRAKKLESLGLLAGGIAHDFNNLLTAILGNIDLSKTYLPPEHKAYKRLEESEMAALKAKDIINQLLTFSKGGEPLKKTVSIASLIKETAALSLLGSNVRCEFTIPEYLWYVYADEGQISQVIYNLFINACQAMPKGGKITVQCENMVVGGETILPILKGEYVKISIHDEGIGISQESLSKIFDPYYTTKPEGTGLGLSVAYSIIKKHGGYISVDSIVGEGTTFVIYLPAVKETIGLSTSIKDKGKDKEIRPLSEKKRILIMDDEEMILDFLKEILTHSGYIVECSKNGQEAIESYIKAKNNGEPFDLVILDYTIPGGMGGKEAIEKLLHINPNVKAIVSSGYTADPIMNEYRSYGFSGILTKPYQINDLLKTIETVFAASKIH